MLFFDPRAASRSDTLRRALDAAIATHRPQVLQHLLDEHGAAAIAGALAPSSSRRVADALSMLPPAARADVTRRMRGTFPAQSSSSGKVRACKPSTT